MKNPPPPNPIPLKLLSACCSEAQADGVPCTELGRDCETCERAVPLDTEIGAATPVETARAAPTPPGEAEEKDDSWAV
jgi:hypothetical protein